MKQTKKQTKKKPTYSTFSNVLWTFGLQWKYAKPSFIFLLISVPLALGQQFIEMLLPKTVVAEIMKQSEYSEILLRVGIMVAALFFFNMLQEIFSKLNYAGYFQKFNQEVHYITELKQYSISYMKAESAAFRNIRERAVQTLWQRGDGSVLTKLPVQSFALIENILCYVLFGGMISFVSPWIVVVLTIAPIVHYIFQYRYNRYEYEMRENWIPVERKMNYVVKGSRKFDTAKDIRIYGLNKWFDDTYKALVKERMVWTKKLLWKGMEGRIADLLIILLRDGLAYIILTGMVLRGEMTVDNFLLYFAAIGSFATWVGGIIENWGQIHSSSLQICDLRDLVNYDDHMNHESTFDVHTLKQPCSIEFQNVSFRYEGAEKDTLHNFNLKIKPGEKLAVVGLNGAGKTTFVKNLCGLYVPTDGTIKVSGHEHTEFGMEDYCSLFSSVFQDFNLFCVTIAEMVASDTKDGLDREKVEQCLKKAGLWERVSALPEGMDTPFNKMVYDNGVDFSGGEKQKLMLAKAVYKNAPILVLDEPTAALDPIAEQQMYLHYSELTEGKTSVFISHRLSSTRFCDRIIFIENGAIAEEGTHDELMKLGGKYAELFEVQSQYYKEGESE